MTPAELITRLRDIADKIDRSNRPSISAVAADIHQLAGEVSGTTYDVQLAVQETECPTVDRIRRPSQLEVDVSQDPDYIRTMSGFRRRASSK